MPLLHLEPLAADLPEDENLVGLDVAQDFADATVVVQIDPSELEEVPLQVLQSRNRLYDG